MVSRKKIEGICDRLQFNMKQSDYMGYDPFDGLNSFKFKSSSLYKSPLLRLCFLQLNKRSPVNLRKFFSISPSRNCKGIALIILGLILESQRKNDSSLLEEAVLLGDWLLSQRCDPLQWGGAAWGYNFDWQARAFYVPTGKPNIITTVYVSLALIALSNALSNNLYRDVAYQSAGFLKKHLLIQKKDKNFFGYIPGESTLVHNANLWGGALLQICGGASCQNIAAEAILTSINAQRNDGSWPYGERHHHQFVDGFHTGYNLEALSVYQRNGGLIDVSSSIEIGLDYYRKNLFDSNGRAKYFNDNFFPVDSHCFAQAILTFLKVGDVSHIEFVGKISEWAIDNLYNPETGWFIYQLNRYYKNKIVYIRWTQAWMYYALEFMLSQIHSVEGKSGISF